MRIDNADIAYLENFKRQYILKCPKCGGKDSFCECWGLFRNELKKIKARIPIKYRQFDFNKLIHPQLTKVKTNIQAYCQELDSRRSQGSSLYLYGSSTLGKTAMGTLILMKAIEKGYTATYYESLSSCVDLLYSEWKEKKDGGELLNHISNNDFIVVDGFGEGTLRDGIPTEQLIRVFRDRSNNLLPTIIIGNCIKSSLKSGPEASILKMFNGELSEIKFSGVEFDKIKYIEETPQELPIEEEYIEEKRVRNVKRK